jgi:tetratricopeptide (TPR) repeat protein
VSTSASKLGRCQHQLGDFSGALRRLREAERLAEKLNDENRKAQVYVSQANANLAAGEIDKALALGSRAFAMAARLHDLRLQIRTRSVLEDVHIGRGDHERAVELAMANLAALPADAIYDHFGSQMPASIANRCSLMRSLAVLGRFPAATKYADEAISLARPTQRLFTDAHVHGTAAIVYLLQGDWLKALSMSEHVATVSRTGNLGLWLPAGVAFSANAQAQLGRRVEALDLLREAQELIGDIETREAMAGLFVSMGYTHLLLGQMDEAERLANLFIKSSSRSIGHVSRARQLLGDIATQRDESNVTAGEAHYRKALALAEPRGMRPVIAHCHFGLSKLYQRTGKHEQAREHLAIATTMYREMDMRFYLEQAEAVY